VKWIQKQCIYCVFNILFSIAALGFVGAEIRRLEMIEMKTSIFTLEGA